MAKAKTKSKKKKKVVIVRVNPNPYFIGEAYAFIPLKEMTDAETERYRADGLADMERIIASLNEDDLNDKARFGTEEYLNGGQSQAEIASWSYPSHLTHVSKLYFEVFEIDGDSIPLEYRSEKASYAQWCKELEQIKTIGGEFLVDGLIRAKRNYDNRHNKGFELDHPSTILKIFRTALEEIEAERNSLFVPNSPEEKTPRSALKSMRDIFDEEE